MAVKYKVRTKKEAHPINPEVSLSYSGDLTNAYELWKYEEEHAYKHNSFNTKKKVNARFFLSILNDRGIPSKYDYRTISNVVGIEYRTFMAYLKEDSGIEITEEELIEAFIKIDRFISSMNKKMKRSVNTDKEMLKSFMKIDCYMDDIRNISIMTDYEMVIRSSHLMLECLEDMKRIIFE